MRWILFILCLLSTPIHTSETFAQADAEKEAERFEAYLENLGLEKLRTEYVEERLATATNKTVRLKIAEQLAEIYTMELLDPANDSAANWRWLNKSVALVSNYPSLRSPTLRVAMLHARYQDQFSGFQKSWYQLDGAKRNVEIVRDFRELIKDLRNLNRLLSGRVTELIELTQIPGNQSEFTDRRLARHENALLHTHYLIGWSSLFRALAENNSSEQLVESERSFRRFLQIEPDVNLVDIDSHWFDFNSDWTLRGLIGLGTCLRMQNRLKASNYCFRLVDLHGKTPNSRRLIPVWKLNSLLYAGEYEKALEWVNNFRSLQLSSTEQAEFWIAAARASGAVEQKSPRIASQMLHESMAGLASQLNGPVIKSLFERQKFELNQKEFRGLWVTGYLELLNKNDAEGLQKAQQKLQSALELSDAWTLKRELACCRFLVAQICYREQKYEEAVDIFENVFQLIRDEAPELAGQALRLKAQSQIEISRLNPRRSGEAFASMDKLLKLYPESKFTSGIAFEKLLLEIAVLPASEAVRRLDRIVPANRNYAIALFEKIRYGYRDWLDEFKSGNTQQEKQFARLIGWEQEHRQLPNANVQRKLKAILLLADAALRNPDPDKEQLAELLRAGKVLSMKQQNVASGLRTELVYYQFKFAQMFDLSESTQHAQWLSRNAVGTPYERASLIFLGQEFDKIVNNGKPDEKQLNTGDEVFSRLVELFGDRPEQLKDSNTSAAVRQLAQIKSWKQDWAEAHRLWELLLKQVPNHQEYLLELARAKTALSRFEEAHPIWRKLGQGVEAGTEIWHEAKLQVVVCLKNMGDPEMAAKVYRQTRQLSPNMPNHWKERYDDVAGTLK